MEYEVVEIKEKMVEGVLIKTTNQDGKSMKDIGIVWQKFFTKGIFESIENKVGKSTIGLYTDYEGDCSMPYYFMAGCEVSDKSTDIGDREVKIIPAGKYAKFIVHGDVQMAVGEAWDKIWKMDLKRKYICDFEEYVSEQEIHIYIGIE